MNSGANNNAVTCIAGLNPAAYHPHALHGPDRNWPETNCYVDLWIEVLSALGLSPEAALGFTVTQDFEGDQFTFFKFPAEDIAALFDIRVQELAIYDTVEAHTLEQLRRGHLVLIEVDSFFLPDTQGTSYRNTHGKTTIAANYLDPAQRQLHYFHNAGYFALSGDDFDGIFRTVSTSALFPYVEFVKLGESKRIPTLSLVIEILRHHLRARPAQNPLRSYAEHFHAHASQLAQRPMEFFHLYAFNTLRQFGANFELLSSHLTWLKTQGETDIDVAIAAAAELATDAKTLQFQLARAVVRKRLDQFQQALAPLATHYDKVMNSLTEQYLK